jgi:hypothetical protein
MFIAPGVPVPAKIPLKMDAEPEPLNTILPVADWLPMVLPVILPQLMFPVNREKADWAVEALVDVTEIF